MRASLQRAEAELRLRNTEAIRHRIFRQVAILMGQGRLTASEAAQIRREFWEARLRDRRLVRGKVR